MSLTGDLEQSIVATADSTSMKPLTASLSKLQKEKVLHPSSPSCLGPYVDDDTFHAPLLAKSWMPFWYSICAEESTSVIVTLRPLKGYIFSFIFGWWLMIVDTSVDSG
jgi:hypothetical protein